MAITFDSRIKELQEKKSKLDKSILESLESQKQWYQQRINELLGGPVAEWWEKEVLDEMRGCYAKVQELDDKIKQFPEDAWERIKEIDKKIAECEARRERVRGLKSYRDTEEWLADVFWTEIIEYAKETKNEDLLNKLRTRSLSEEEYWQYFQQDYRKHDENQKMYEQLSRPEVKCQSSTESESQATESKPVELPEWMAEEIREMLKDSEEFKCLSADEVERFMLKELRKNYGEIKDKHIRNKFVGVREYKAAFNLIRYLTTKYPEFTILKWPESKPTTTPQKTKNDKLVEEAMQSRSSEIESDEIKNSRLIELSKISKIKGLSDRCRKYIDLWEELWWKFSDKEDFINILENIIKTQTNIQFETLFNNLLRKIIQTDFKPEHKWGEEYYSYDLWDWTSRRNVVIYPNGEIVNIVRHDEYLRLIRQKPPINKRRDIKRKG